MTNMTKGRGVFYMYFTYPDFITSNDEWGKNPRVKRGWSLKFHDKIVMVAIIN